MGKPERSGAFKPNLGICLDTRRSNRPYLRPDEAATGNSHYQKGRRALPWEMFPFSFRELLDYKGIESEGARCLGPVDVRRAVEYAASIAFNEIKYRACLVRGLHQVPAVLASDGKLAQVGNRRAEKPFNPHRLRKTVVT